MTCWRAIDCEKMIDHIWKDLPLVKVPDELPSILQTAYDLISYHKAVIHASGTIPPVFGIPLEESLLYFCQCGRGVAGVTLSMTPFGLIRQLIKKEGNVFSVCRI